MSSSPTMSLCLTAALRPDTNAATLVTAEGEEDVPLGTKRALGPRCSSTRIETLIHAPVPS